ncbi:MAG: polyamine aminopropyltransferase [Polyangiaceae bacterium]|nr:polyamine aminopropyltransferase [Polyangiaceae bacterium]MCE7889509.1 polyamine aminopropyltransferase [Sorangiineae bacterium PRO1]MCL4754144.1 polyamine aminopropyltransferase [Myxococcales bacterium]
MTDGDESIEPKPRGWPDPGRAAPARTHATLLLSMVLVIATAGLVYELVMAAVASYVLGDSVTQFSTVIGVYLSAMGLGAWLSRFAERRLSLLFVDIELGTALIGGLCAPGLLLAFSYTNAFRLILYATVVAVGVLVGLELPLLMRILRRELEFKELIARALTFDYAGALVGSLAFSLFLVPRLGLVHTSLACGLLNAAVGLLSTWVLVPESEEERRGMAGARLRAVFVLVLLGLALLQGKHLTSLAEAQSFGGRVLHAESSPYQRIVLSERGNGFALHLNGNLQFTSRDEHRYHEALVHPAMAAAASRRRVLVGGGGDGLAVREILRWPDVERVVLVDLDRAVTDLARTRPELVAQNQGSLSDPKVQVINADAMIWVAESRESFDVIVLDFPDPSNYSVGKLYSTELYQRVRARLAPGGALGVQSTSPLLARQSFWCVVGTLRAVGLSVLPYRVYVPSFADWGFVLAGLDPVERPTRLPPGPLAYLDAHTLAQLFELPSDVGELPVEPNRLNNQALVSYYLREWSRWE